MSAPPAAPRVRRRSAADLPACVRALESVHVADAYPARWPADPAGWLSPSRLAAAWVGVRGNALLGHVCVVHGGPEPTVPGTSGGRTVLVSRLFVVPPARSSGLAAALLAEATSWAATCGRPLTLDVVEDSAPAVALYERLGWHLVDRRPADWTMPDGRRPYSRVYRAPTA